MNDTDRLIDAYVAEVVADAPPATDEQVEEIRAMFVPAPAGEREARPESDAPERRAA